jgi:hypothetical protein
VLRKGPELWPNDWIFHHDNDPAQKVLFRKQFLAQKSIIEMKYPPNSSDDFWLLPKIKSAFKGRRFQNIEDIKKEKRNVRMALNYSTTGVPTMFPTVAASLG